MSTTYITLPRTDNQARALGDYAIAFLREGKGKPSARVLAKVEAFHRDSVACAVAALAEGCNAPVVLRDEALSYSVSQGGAFCFGSSHPVAAEKAIVANCAAVRELDANGTNFGFNPATGTTAGEFGHNDFYPVAIAAAQVCGGSGNDALLGMTCIDEIRGRLAECFSLKTHKIDHVVHGAIAAAAVYGAMLGATAEQIESAVGLVVSHYVPFRAIRHGEQLSDSKGASAALSAEMAALSVHRAMRGLVGPGDIFRNRQALFCLFEPPLNRGESPFDLRLAMAGEDFAIQGMHFKLGLYEHQTAGAIQALIDLLAAEPRLGDDWRSILKIRIAIYEPAFSIVGDFHKRDPRTRQSADHSMVYILATLLRRAGETRDRTWAGLMPLPSDYSEGAIFHPVTRSIMERIEFVHGGAEFDAGYPDGIPTTVEIQHSEWGWHRSARVMYPLGHARNTSGDLEAALATKFTRLASLGGCDAAGLARHLHHLAGKNAAEMRELISFPIRIGEPGRSPQP